MTTKKILLFASLIVLILLGLVFTLLTPRPQNSNFKFKISNSPTPTPALSYRLLPPAATKEEVISRLGQPQRTFQFEDQTVLAYPTATKWNHLVFLANNQLVLTKEIVLEEDRRTKKFFFSNYGQPEVTYYGPISEADFDLFAYPTKGFALLASNHTDLLAEIWYFLPTSADNFQQNIALKHGYSTQKPEPKE